MLIVLAMLLSLGGLGMMILAIALPTPGETGQLARGLMILVVSFCVAGLLLGCAVILKMQQTTHKLAQAEFKKISGLQEAIAELQQKIAEMPQQQYYAAAPMVAPPPTPEEQKAAAQMAESLAMVAEVRDLLLMNAEQREARSRAHWEQRKSSMRAEVERLISAGDWSAAEREIRSLQAIAPQDTTMGALFTRITQEQERRLNVALTEGRVRIRHFMSITAWPQAGQILDQLRAQFPDSVAVEELAAEVASEREAFDRETIARLYQDVKDASERREWRRAHASAEELVRRYPHDKKAEKIRGELDTMKENADSQERREQEELFKDLLKRQRYDEAYSVAMGVINKYPASPSAAELNKLLPKVEELIRQGQAARTT
jgi:hypothetical protein